jgi:eukaryotic translation initiation factor 2C
MRFFAINPADADRTGNLPPGTVIEKGVTHPYAFDFYRTSSFAFSRSS